MKNATKDFLTVVWILLLCVAGVTKMKTPREPAPLPAKVSEASRAGRHLKPAPDPPTDSADYRYTDLSRNTTILVVGGSPGLTRLDNALVNSIMQSHGFMATLDQRGPMRLRRRTSFAGLPGYTYEGNFEGKHYRVDIAGNEVRHLAIVVSCPIECARAEVGDWPSFPSGLFPGYNP